MCVDNLQEIALCFILYLVWAPIIGSFLLLFFFFLFAAVRYVASKIKDGSSLMRSPSERFGFEKFPRYSIFGRLIDPTNTCVYIILLSSVLGCLLSQPFQKKIVAMLLLIR